MRTLLHVRDRSNEWAQVGTGFDAKEGRGVRKKTLMIEATIHNFIK